MVARKSPLFLVLTLLVATSAAAAPPRWTFMDLGALFNTAEAFWPYGVNDLGQVAGSGKQGFVQGMPQGPFVTAPNTQVNWSPRPGDPSRFVDQVVQGTYDNDPQGSVLDPAPFVVNNLGVTTGRGYSYPHDMTFLGSRTQTTAIGPTGTACTGYAINDAGEVAGVIATVGGWLHAVRLAGGNTEDLGTFRTLPPTRDNDRSEALAINQSGTIVGYAANDVFSPGIGTNETHAFRWTQGTGLVDLGTAGGPVSRAWDINASGAIAGYSLDPGHNQVAVVWSPSNVLSVIPNGAQTFPNSARWITDAGWVVGGAHIVPTGAGYFLHHEGQTYDLATLIDDDGTHWTNLVFTDMNAVGQIVGYGTNDDTPAGARRAFLLTHSGIVPTTLSLVEAQASAERVTLGWYAAQDLHATLQRRSADEAWSNRAEVSSDGSGMIRFEDAEVVAGRRYGYRLALQANGRTEFLGETWVDVPATLALAIRGFQPNPGPGRPTVSFALPHAGAARLELLDPMGRLMTQRSWSRLEGGSHVIPLAGEKTFAPGVYTMRLTFEGLTVATNGVILRR
jgi:probable HAF family extracellular repeat protein